MKPQPINLLHPISVSALLLSSIFLPAFANTTQLGRYLTVDNKPKQEQIHLLAQTIHVRFPLRVQTIGEAMQYLLKPSGYDLLAEKKQSEALKITLQKPLPAIDRDFGPMRLDAGLATLAGPVFNLVDDPLNRTVNFRIRKNDQKK